MYDDEVFEKLASAVQEVAIPPDGDALAEVLGLIDLLQAKVSAAIGEFETEKGWEADGATSAVAWLRHRAGMTLSTANNVVRTARSLRRLPITAAAWRDGSLTGGQVQAVVKNVDNRLLPVFAEAEATVVPAIAELSVRDTATAMQIWAARAETLLEDSEPCLPERNVSLSSTLDGRWVLNGDLDPEGGSIVETAIRLASSRDHDVNGEPWRTPARRRADALVDVCRWFLDHQQDHPGGRHRPHLNVVIDYDELLAGGPGRLVEGGGMLDGPSMHRLLCDAAVHRVVTDGRSTILDYGTSTRTVPVNLWAALVLRDQHCRHDGCDRPSAWCEAHHVTPVLEGGATSLDNLVLKCTRHHHLGHQPGWHEKLRPDGTLVTTDPAGRTRTTRPPGVNHQF